MLSFFAFNHKCGNVPNQGTLEMTGFNYANSKKGRHAHVSFGIPRQDSRAQDMFGKLVRKLQREDSDSDSSSEHEEAALGPVVVGETWFEPRGPQWLLKGCAKCTAKRFMNVPSNTQRNRSASALLPRESAV